MEKAPDLHEADKSEDWSRFLKNGHLDLIRRSARLCDELVVAIAHNDAKKPVFTLEERLELLRAVTAEFPNVAVDSFRGLTVEFAHSIGAQVIIRGLRFVTDLEYELQMALANRKMVSDIETLFLAPSEEFSFLSSTLVREIALGGGDVSGYVPPAVLQALRRKFGGSSKSLLV
ncbi:MAG: pantetheine-phosphate adenylyltransferase [Candidatus Sumerlaeota bacterium]|nr:pantetheine-phosphate adenylyltransferase [Candidatus Sumerlaeota bacterium]